MNAEANVETTPARRNRRAVQGVVVSNKMNKTIVVEVTRHVQHPRYRKFVRSSKKYKAHDETEQCTIGDLVTIVETRPMSKHKRWRLRSIDRKAVG